MDNDELEDAEKDIVEIAMKKLDTNRDGQITYDDFQMAVRQGLNFISVKTFSESVSKHYQL